MNAIKFIVVVCVCVAILCFAKKYFGHNNQAAARRGGGKVAVETFVAAKRPFANRIEAIGTARANESITVTSTVLERVTEICFDSGDTVKAGDVLVRLNDVEERAKLQEIKVRLAEENLKLKRTKKLKAENVVTEQDLDTQQSAVDALAANLEAAEAVLRERTITAPFSGVLGIRQISPGTSLSPGEPITTLDDLSLIKMEFSVPETFFSVIKTGQKIEARSIAWPGEVFTGTVSSIDSRIDEVTRAIAIQAKMPNSELKIREGMLMTIELISNQHDAIGIPEKALVSYSDHQYVYVLQKDNTVSRKEVKLGLRNSGWVEITEGIAEGDTIISEGVMNLREGAQVEVLGKPEKTSGSSDDKNTTASSK